MLSPKMNDALNEQINREMYSAFIYMSMSNRCNELGLKGFTNWFMVQYHEEMFHSMRIYEYVCRQGGKVTLKAIAQPPADFASPLDMMTKTLEHERYITQSINDLMDLAICREGPRHPDLPPVVRHRAGGGGGERQRDHRPVEAHPGQPPRPHDDRSGPCRPDGHGAHGFQQGRRSGRESVGGLKTEGQRLKAKG